MHLLSHSSPMYYSKPDPLIFPCFFVMPRENVMKTSNSIPPENKKPVDILRYCKETGKFESGSPFENNLYEPEDKWCRNLFLIFSEFI